uniref:Small ribosomal subunit protein uS15m n=1 Tax=Lynceus sp. MCZ IZ 141354 TaxID=1930659 RepID=A0A9N6ZFM4_9CRUS|nr:EOG090X09BQ [Lynceus sp. MCZ IZ 141354]
MLRSFAGGLKQLVQCSALSRVKAPGFVPVRTAKQEVKIEWRQPPHVPCILPEKSGDLQPNPVLPKSTLLFRYDKCNELHNADPIVHQLLTVEFSEKSKALQTHLQQRLAQLQCHQFDSGSRTAAITALTIRIRNLQLHTFAMKKDKVATRFLKEMIDRRNKFLRQLRLRDYRRFEWLLQELQIRHKALPTKAVFLTKKQNTIKLTQKYCDDLQARKMTEYRNQLEEERKQFAKEKEAALKWIEKEEHDLKAATK